MALILASASPRRQELLALLGRPFRVVPTDVDERAVHAASPALLAGELARAKCQAAMAEPGDTVIGCDTVVDVDGQVLGKPKDRADAVRMMQLLSGRWHQVHTGVAVRRNGVFLTHTETTRVHFAALTAQEIEQYADTREPYDKAGGYGIQGWAARFVKGVDGCYFNVVGLPVHRLYRMLQQIDKIHSEICKE